MTQTPDQTDTRVQPASHAGRPTLTGQEIAQAQGAVRALLDRVLGESRVGTDGYIVLRVLAFRGGVESPAVFHGYLAGQRQLGLDEAAVAALLRGLEADDLISGSSLDGPGPVQLTALGAALRTSLAASIAAVTQPIYAGLDREELAVAHDVLERITRQAEQLRAAI